MYEAFIVFVTLAGGMTTGSDSRGPYVTEAQCRERAVEMVEYAVEAFAEFGLVQAQGFCKKSEGQAA